MLLGVALRKDIFPFRVEMFMVKTACQLAKMGLRPPRRP